jgi:IS4 transposase
LRQTAAYAQTVGFATISDVALLKRLRRCGPWLGELLAHKLAQRAGRGELPRNQLRLRLIDATTVARPGSTGIDWRLHMSMDVSRGRVGHIELTDAKGAETLTRFAFASSDLVIADRGYAKAKDLDHVSRANAFFIIRTSRHSMKLEHRDGRPFDYVEGLNQLPEAAAGEFAVQVRVSPKHTLPCRLIGIRKSEPAAERTRSKILAESRKKHRITDPRTLESAGFMAVLTNLPVDQATPEQILDLYRFRWQIEMNFKDLKSVLELDALPAKDPALARTYLYAKLLGTLLIDDLTTRYLSFSPWGYKVQPAPLDLATA